MGKFKKGQVVWWYDVAADDLLSGEVRDVDKDGFVSFFRAKGALPTPPRSVDSCYPTQREAVQGGMSTLYKLAREILDRRDKLTTLLQ